MKCYDWFFDAHTSTRMYKESEDALRELREEWGSDRVLDLDAYNPTRRCCERGCEDETDDGEHYAGLDASFVVSLAAMLGSSGDDKSSLHAKDALDEGHNIRNHTSGNQESRKADQSKADQNKSKGTTP